MTVAYDPFDPEQVDHQDEVFADLRPRCPVAPVMPGMYLLTRYEDVVRASRDPESFPQAPFRPREGDTRTSDELQLGETNPPLHGPLRKVLQGVLSSRRVRAMQPDVRAVCEGLADDLAGRTHADLVEVLARPLPTIVIGDLTGVPEELRPHLHDYSDDVVTMTQGDGSEACLAATRRVEQFDARLREVVQRRRASGDRPDDALSALLDAVGPAGAPLSDAKVVLHLARDLITGGIDTTTHLVGNLFWDLLTTPGAYARVRDHRDLVPVAVEESLRHLPIVSVLFRQPREDVEVAGTDIPAGSLVALSYASANRDPAVFPHPDRFDLDRGEQARQHLGFGTGAHLCLGAALARLEATELLDAVLDRVPEMRLAAGERYERVPFFMMRGPRHLAVELGAG